MATPPLPPTPETVSVPASNTIPQSIDLIWTMGLHKISDQIQVVEALDSKTGVVLGFVVVSIVEILGFLILAATEATSPAQLAHSQALSFGVVALLLCGMLSSIASTTLGLLSLQVQKLAIGFDYAKMVERANLSESQLKATFVDDLLLSISENEKELASKVKFARWSGIYVLGGLICYTIVAVMLFWAFVPGR